VEAQPKEIQGYSQPVGTVPFDDWLDSLRDLKGKAKIVRRLQRVSNGNLGDYRSLGESIFELRIDFSPGYRVYFGQIETIVVLLLLEKLDNLLSGEGNATIYALANWLKVLGLKLTVAVAAENEESESDSVSDVEEFAPVGNT
jgi:putative addiction module killer protein